MMRTGSPGQGHEQHVLPTSLPANGIDQRQPGTEPQSRVDAPQHIGRNVVLAALLEAEPAQAAAARAAHSSDKAAGAGRGAA